MRKTIRKLEKKLIKYRVLIYISLSFGLGILFGTFYTSTMWIGQSVKDQCLEAQTLYQKDCVQSLIGYTQNSGIRPEKHSRAVWALGQLGDKRALPTLEKLYDGSECDHENKLCQYELKKAIKLIKSGINITAPFWRYRIK